MKELNQQWMERNQQYLSAAMTVVRSNLEHHIARVTGQLISDESAGQTLAAQEKCAEISKSTSPSPALITLCDRFNLTAFERDVLLFCTGMELDAAFASSAASAHNDAKQPFLTFGLALAAFPQPHWNALLPTAPLRYWRLVEFSQSGGSPGAPLTTRGIRIDEKILHYLTGIQHLDERLSNGVTRVRPPKDLMPTQQVIADRMVRSWSTPDRKVTPLLVLYGADRVSARLIAASACRSLGLGLYCLNAHTLPAGASDLHSYIRLWERESSLGSTALFLNSEDMERNPSHEACIAEFVERMSGPLIVFSRELRTIENRPAITFEVARPGTRDQHAAWSFVLPESNHRLNGQLDLLTSQFCLNLSEIDSAAAEATSAPDSGPSFDALWDACRKQTRSQLDTLAQRIECNSTLDDLVLPENQKEILRDIAAQVRQRSKVYEAWGFAQKSNRGLGISALFAGASGTGKTMAAEVLAGALRLDLYRIDLSSVVSKYIGETEKNLRRVFDAAEAGGAILLFDEADALFGKRSEVKDSHDRYANIEVSYLLQRMESYRGLAILTTNMKSALDQAFLRRIRFVVQFPFPDAVQRAQIWRQVFPKAAPTIGLNHDKLAQLNVAGGNIRNMAVTAAFIAADLNEPVGMSHVLRAARSEYAKLDKPLTDAEIADWMEITV
jgi:AAA+ superfamily predicted ATPase